MKRQHTCGSASRLKELLNVLRKRDIAHGITPEKLRLIFEDLGPTYVKLGQIMSMRSDILPHNYCSELEKLRTTVSPVPFTEILSMIHEEYGCSATQVFSSIDSEPLGSASIAQVYRATLREDGSRVVIKVQRPGIHDKMAQDVKLMHKAVCLLKHIGNHTASEVFDFDAVIGEMWTVAQQEMNFLLEAEHNEEFVRLNKDVAYVKCPKINRQLTTERILVMEQIDGIPVDHIDELKKSGYDIDEIGAKLCESYSKQVMDDAFFHADPHPGNIWVSDGKIVFLDLGMMGRLSRRDQRIFRTAIKAISEQDVHKLKEVILTLGMVNKPIDHARMYADVEALLKKYSSADLASINLGEMIQEGLALASQYEIKMPSSITMLARGVITLEGVMAKCCPNVSLIQIIKNHLSTEFTSTFNIREEIEQSGRSIYHSAKKSLEIPGNLSDLLNMCVKGHGKLNLEIVGSEEPLSKIDEMVNKIIVSLIAASLLLGSSFLCTTNMHPKILGLPAVGMIGFLLAFVLCVFLVCKILFKKNK